MTLKFDNCCESFAFVLYREGFRLTWISIILLPIAFSDNFFCEVKHDKQKAKETIHKQRNTHTHTLHIYIYIYQRTTNSQAQC